MATAGPEMSATTTEMWRVSDATTISSAYTTDSHLARVHNSDASVPPLFSATQINRPSLVPRPVDRPTNRREAANAGRMIATKAARAGAVGLGIVTNARSPWKGSNARSNQMAPITELSQNNDVSDQQGPTRFYTVRHGKVSPLGDRAEEEINHSQLSPISSVSGIGEDHYRPPVPLKIPNHSPTGSFTSTRTNGAEWNSAHTKSLKSSSLERWGGVKQAAAALNGLNGQNPLASNPTNTSPPSQQTSPRKPHPMSVSPVTPESPNETPAPVSRFSWTTRATSMGEPSTPLPRTSKDTIHSTPPRVSTDQQQQASHFSWATHTTPEYSPERTPLTGKTVHDIWAQSGPLSTVQESSNEPGSRFSWSTHPTQQSTPHRRMRHEELPPMPPTPPSRPTSPAFSVMSRGRPLRETNGPPVSYMPTTDRPFSVKRKPAPSEAGSISTVADVMFEAGPIGPNKNLPLAPPELASVDIITALEAQIEEQVHRRRNLEKVIHGLKELQPHNPLVQDLAKRRADKEKLEKFEYELAEVRSKEYELGLRLHRAWKKREQDAPTALWVRRVTH